MRRSEFLKLFGLGAASTLAILLSSCKGEEGGGEGGIPEDQLRDEAEMANMEGDDEEDQVEDDDASGGGYDQ